MDSGIGIRGLGDFHRTHRIPSNTSILFIGLINGSFVALSFVSILGFLIGATVAGGAGYYYLLEEYQTASNLLLGSVEDLQTSTNKVHIRGIGLLESMAKSNYSAYTAVQVTTSVHDLVV